MKSKPAAAKRWEEMVARYGCVVTREPNVQIHHVLGRTARHNKVDIGWFYILPLAVQLHDVHSNHPANVTHYPKRFAEEFGYQRDLFLKMVTELRRQGKEIPFGNDVLAAIGNSPLR